MFDIITIGDCTMDTIVTIDQAEVKCDLKKTECKLCFNYADKIPIKHSKQSLGGNACNIAVSCSKLGLRSAIVSELGDDINGYAIKNELEHKRVDTRFIKNIKNNETRYSVILNYQAERTVLSYHADRKYNFPKINKTKWIYYTSLGKNFEKTQDKMMHYIFQNPETKLAINPGSFQIKYALKKIKSILQYCDILFVNKQEAQKIIGKKDNTKTLLEKLIKKGIKTVVITDGENGSFVADKDTDQKIKMKIYPGKKIAKTGAGDAYASGFVSAIIKEKDIKTAMMWGTANANNVVRDFGAQNGLANVRTINKTIKANKHNTPKILT